MATKTYLLILMLTILTASATCFRSTLPTPCPLPMPDTLRVVLPNVPTSEEVDSMLATYPIATDLTWHREAHTLGSRALSDGRCVTAYIMKDSIGLDVELVTSRGTVMTDTVLWRDFYAVRQTGPRGRIGGNKVTVTTSQLTWDGDTAVLMREVSQCGFYIHGRRLTPHSADTTIIRYYP